MNKQQIIATTLVVVLLAQGVSSKDCSCSKAYAGAAAGAISAWWLFPAAVVGIGFAPAGIVAGSLAASMMSSAATTGIGMATVGVGQSIGAAGLSVAGQTVVGGVGAAIGYKAFGGCDCPC